jgi:hypothetical protein
MKKKIKIFFKDPYPKLDYHKTDSPKETELKQKLVDVAARVKKEKING